MRRAAHSLFLVLILLAATLARAEESRIGLPWDWSHRSIIHHPETGDEAMARGAYGEWIGKTADPRYLSQLLRKVDQQAAAAEAATKALPDTKKKKAPATIDRDWSHVMGGASGVGFAGTFPAKYGFDINAAPDCQNDYVVYTTASAGATGSGNFASNSGTFTTTNGTGTVTITSGSTTLTLTASTTLNTGLDFQVANGTAAATRAQNLAAAINRNGGVIGVTASASGAVVTYTSITQGTGHNSITDTSSVKGFKWNSNNASGGTGTAGQPTIFAVNQLYTSCASAASVPGTYWSYNTGTGVFAELSPVLSLDGTQVAFIQRTNTVPNVASLVLLKWSATTSVGTVGAPTTPATAASAAAYRTCTAPCMLVMSLGANDITSSPFVRYDNDELYVGDAAGRLHKFSGVFTGTPTEVGSPFAVVSSGNALSSPVYDEASDFVFVGSARGTTTGGQLHSVNSSGTVVSTGQLGGNPTAGSAATGVADTPLVDSQGQRVYAFVASDTSTSCTGANCMAVYQFSTATSLNGLTTPRAQIGEGNTATFTLRAGAFDNTYWTSANSASPSGFLYVCGAQANNASRPTLWRIPITANVMGTPAIGPRITNNTATPPCSPPVEISNGTSDFLFTSVSADGNQTNCTGACVYLFNITSITAANWANTSAVTGLAATGGTGGIIFDNISTVSGASQVYYSTLTSPGNAIQASQAGLN